MSSFVGIGLLVLGGLMIWGAKANADGTPKAFLKNDFYGLIYPVFCLAVIAAGVGFIVA
jgi:hypothetical protein